MAKLKTIYICSECGYESVRWLGRCPTCKAYDVFVEDVVQEKTGREKHSQSALSTVTVKALAKIEPMSDERVRTGIDELDRVLSGGLVRGSLTLTGGEPGVGKSTLLLQICKHIMLGADEKILYVSGEESLAQIKLRAERLGIVRESLYIIQESTVAAVESTVLSLDPSLVIIDSIQTMTDENIGSAAGSVTQIRECSSYLMRLTKNRGISVILIGHVTKDGAIAGPRILEHMVDTVLYFEGDKNLSYRVIRAVKNRFGATNEIGVFEMRETGLFEISNPSEYMLSGRPKNAAGSVVTCSLEGTRPILAEVQALVCRTSFGMPRRVATGMDYNRMVMLVALLEKRAGLGFSNYDSYVNIAGGLKINEPALDLAAVAALASGFKNRPISDNTVIFGEAGLTGEARAVAQAEKRVYEAAKLGFTECVIPQANLKGLRQIDGIRVFGAGNISEMLELLQL